MKKEIFKRTEARLYDMYNKINKIDALKKECEELEHEAKMIIDDIESVNINIEAEMHFGIDYSSISVQTSSDGDSYMDKELVSAICRLEREWRKTKLKIVKKKEKIRKLKRDIRALKNEIENICNNCSNVKKKEEYARVLKHKYNHGKGIDEIAELINISISTAKRRRTEIVERVARFYNYI